MNTFWRNSIGYINIINIWDNISQHYMMIPWAVEVYSILSVYPAIFLFLWRKFGVPIVKSSKLWNNTDGIQKLCSDQNLIFVIFIYFSFQASHSLPRFRAAAKIHEACHKTHSFHIRLSFFANKFMRGAIFFQTNFKPKPFYHKVFHESFSS